MPILELPPNPSRTPETTGTPMAQPTKVRTGRFGELEEHELIHLLDTLDDERSKARFRESIYISLIVYMAIAWFLFYGPRVLFHRPEYKDLVTAMKEHDSRITYVEPPHMAAARPPALDRKTLQQLQQQRPRVTAPAPAQPQATPTPTPPPPPQEQARTTPQPPLPQAPIPQAPVPQPTASRPNTQAIPDAPAPNLAQNTHSAVQDAIRGSRGGGGAQYGNSPGSMRPLQAGAEILSPTEGVDFSAYMRRLHNDIQRNWDPLIPEEVQPPLLKRGIVGIRFTILPGGQIGAMTLETRSGDVALDKAAWSAITAEGNFPPLPKEFHGPQLELRVGFFYNTPIQQ